MSKMRREIHISCWALTSNWENRKRRFFSRESQRHPWLSESVSENSGEKIDALVTERSSLMIEVESWRERRNRVPMRWKLRWVNSFRKFGLSENCWIWRLPRMLWASVSECWIIDDQLAFFLRVYRPYCFLCRISSPSICPQFRGSFSLKLPV